MTIFSLRNNIASADCYKFSHTFVISKSVDELTSYIEPRKGKASKVVFFGLQAYIREYLSRPITMEIIDREERKAKSALIPFHREMWEYIVTHHGGFIPVEIQALPEGTPVNYGVPVIQIKSKCKKFPGVISIIETALLRATWYPSSVATLSREIKINLKKWLIITSDLDPDILLPTMLNDFGARGVSSGESAALGGLGHLVNFIGSDTFEAIDAATEYYDHNLDRDGPVLISVPATEHSVTTMNGEEGELKFLEGVIDTFTEMGFPIISTVADSYDMDRFVDQYVGKDLREKILHRNGFIVVRPDSGEPTEIVPRVLELLWNNFGGTINEKGFKVLDPHIRVIQGDGVNQKSIEDILHYVAGAGFSVENLVFGMGGALLQGPMRDDHSWAMKTNEAIIDGEVVGVQKMPKTDPTKASKKGRQAVVFREGEYVSIHEDDLLEDEKNFLEIVWSDGRTIRSQTFKEVRENAKL